MPEQYVKQKLFLWILGIWFALNTTIVGFVYGKTVDNRASCDANSHEIGLHILEIKTQLSQIQTDIEWIKNNPN